MTANPEVGLHTVGWTRPHLSLIEKILFRLYTARSYRGIFFSSYQVTLICVKMTYKEAGISIIFAVEILNNDSFNGDNEEYNLKTLNILCAL